ncbi:MAG: hypothetical protein A2622_04000 [Bdellovibrionales bacterium RIFCSPHIGHO2_01_FULL_40_29]|nr:MAG: hypothetical protein A2622_04000 [Bdellovibrionales bacterium RIFCSPHIGHO2_01_FULL_40_29]OFZ35326.1 MAG: hypothetical protein A3D17_08030 [Bdellovibrionales bacterium RIFCSPHIGHO2_02_FULL_40_15]
MVPPFIRIEFMLLKILLTVVLLLNSSCIHLNSTDHKSVELENSKPLYQETIIFEKLQIENFIYTESVYPLEKFLKELVAGDFNEVLSKIDFNYKPSNTDNKIILELIKEGLVPVYVNIKNTGSNTVKISEKNFYITDGVAQVQALSLENIPRSFKRFNSKSVAANAYNMSVVFVGTVAALVVLGIISHGGTLPGDVWSGWGSKKHSSDGKNKILNDTDKTTQIDYKNYLISEQTIEPNKNLQGLLFFRYTPASSSLRLKLEPMSFKN